MWIKRQIESILVPESGTLRVFPVWFLLGPRQVGKSSVLRRMADANREFILLDDPLTRAQATHDPVLFGKNLKPPVCLDEIQYVPELLSSVKILADQKPGPGAIWLTGSQSFEVMKGVQESLAGRVGIVRLLGLSDFEHPGKKPSPSDRWERPKTPAEYYEQILGTTFPEVVAQGMNQAERELYLASYIETYVERDV